MSCILVLKKIFLIDGSRDFYLKKKKIYSYNYESVKNVPKTVYSRTKIIYFYTLKCLGLL